MWNSYTPYPAKVILPRRDHRAHKITDQVKKKTSYKIMLSSPVISDKKLWPLSFKNCPLQRESLDFGEFSSGEGRLSSRINSLSRLLPSLKMMTKVSPLNHWFRFSLSLFFSFLLPLLHSRLPINSLVVVVSWNMRTKLFQALISAFSPGKIVDLHDDDC